MKMPVVYRDFRKVKQAPAGVDPAAGGGALAADRRGSRLNLIKSLVEFDHQVCRRGRAGLARIVPQTRSRRPHAFFDAAAQFFSGGMTFFSSSETAEEGVFTT